MTTTLLMMATCTHHANADDEQPGIQLNERLRLHTTVETEWYRDKTDLSDLPETVRERDNNLAVEFELNAEITESIDASLGFTYDLEDDHGELDVYSISWETERATLSLGLQELPFAGSESQFFTDPLTAFGTLDARSIIADFEVVDGLEITAAAYRGFAARAGSSLNSADWVVGATATPADGVELTLAYLSDLADSDERLLDDEDNRYEQKVPAISLLAVWSHEALQFSVEATKALRSFDALDEQTNRPDALSAEIGWAWRDDVDLAVRFERSRELAEAPRSRAGLAAIWRFHPNAALAVEWLRGRYARDFAFDDDDNPLSRNNFIGAQLTIRF